MPCSAYFFYRLKTNFFVYILKDFAGHIKEYRNKVRLNQARVRKERWRERLKKAAKAKDANALSKIEEIQKSGRLRAEKQRKRMKAARKKKRKAVRKKKRKAVRKQKTMILK